MSTFVRKNGVLLCECIGILVAGLIVLPGWYVSIQPPPPMPTAITFTPVTACPNTWEGFSKRNLLSETLTQDVVEQASNEVGSNLNAPGYICVSASFPLKVGSQTSKAWITSKVANSSPLLVLSIKKEVTLTITFYSRGGEGPKETFCTSPTEANVEEWNPKTGETVSESLVKYCTSNR